jgi:hypothetical protein
MSVYGIRSLAGKFSVHTRELAAGSEYRFGGADAQIVYDKVTGEVVNYTTVDGVNVIAAHPNNIVNVVLKGVQLDKPAQFPNLRFELVTSSLDLDIDSYAVLLEGVAEVNGNLLDSSVDVHIIEPYTTVKSDSAKLVVFNFVQP